MNGHRYKIGDVVLARDPNGVRSAAFGEPWCEARITALQPYLGSPGYYVAYSSAKQQWHCAGGWQAEHMLREVTP